MKIIRKTSIIIVIVCILLVSMAPANTAYAGLCPHLYTKSLPNVYTYEKFDGDVHRIHGEGGRMQCCICGHIKVGIELDSFEKHDFSKNNGTTCSKCGQHRHVVKEYRPSKPEYRNHNAYTHKKIVTYNIPICYCGSPMESVAGKGDTKVTYENHTYKSSKCTVCGAKCPHKYSSSSDRYCDICGYKRACPHNYKSMGNANTTYSDFTDKTHTKVTKATDQKCTHCGHIKKGTTSRATANHTFDNDQNCTVCGHHVHKGTIAVWVDPVYSSNNDGTHEQTLIPDRTRCPCGKIMDQGTSQTTTKDCTYDSKGVCQKCGHRKDIAVTGVSLSKTSMTIKPNACYTLWATVSPSNAANKSLKWSSSNSSVATVNSSGMIEPLKPGKTVITVKTVDGGKTAKCTVTVQDTNPTVAVTSVSLSRYNLTINDNAGYTLRATVSPSNATNKSLKWSSSNTSVAKVNSNGVITPLRPGSAFITVKTVDGGKTAKCAVIVKDSNPMIGVTGVSLSETTMHVQDNACYRLIATVSPANATNKSVTWSSSNASIVKVDNKGMLIPLKEGTTTITVKSVDGGRTASCSVVVSHVHDEDNHHLVEVDIVPYDKSRHKVITTSGRITCSCGHVMDAGTDVITYEPHNFELMTCKDCGYTHKEHEYSDDKDTTCNICGYEREVIIYDPLPPPECEHSPSDWIYSKPKYTYTILDDNYDKHWVEGTVTITCKCGEIIDLDYISGYEEDHEFDNGICVKCGMHKECEHTFKDGKCTKCGMHQECKHTFKDGECTQCGELHDCEESKREVVKDYYYPNHFNDKSTHTHTVVEDIYCDCGKKLETATTTTTEKHSWVNGYCEHCNIKMYFENDPMPFTGYIDETANRVKIGKSLTLDWGNKGFEEYDKYSVKIEYPIPINVQTSTTAQSQYTVTPDQVNKVKEHGFDQDTQWFYVYVFGLDNGQEVPLIRYSVSVFYPDKAKESRVTTEKSTYAEKPKVTNVSTAARVPTITKSPPREDTEAKSPIKKEAPTLIEKVESIISQIISFFKSVF